MAPRIAPARTPVLLTVADVAEQLQFSTRTIRRMIDRGEIPFIRIGRQMRVAPNDLAAFVHGSRAMTST